MAFVMAPRSFISSFLPESKFLSPEIHFSDSSTEPAGIDPTTTAMEVRCATNPAIEELCIGTGHGNSARPTGMPAHVDRV